MDSTDRDKPQELHRPLACMGASRACRACRLPQSREPLPAAAVALAGTSQ